jgi:predicted ATPase/DNA-binding SARP family transcriptional activator
VGVSAFRVLGPVEAWTDERRLVLGGPQQVKLLAFLLLNANRAVSADAVFDAVWGADRDGAAKRLQMGVVRLRKSLAPLDGQNGPRLRTVSGGYLLSVAPGEMDADVFAERVQEGRGALDAGDAARAREVLSAALQLWRGPPLAEVAFADFAQAEIRRLEELRLEALESRVDADLELGAHARLVGELQALLVEQPTRERVAGQLMLALYESDRQADALDVYQRTRARLADELGLEPGPALKKLHAEILEQSNSIAGSAPGLSQLRARPTASALPQPATLTIGREQEIDAVSRLLCRSDARLVALVGPGGVGKTRLALVVSHSIQRSFRDGVCWVELAGVARTEDVDFAIAQGLRVRPVEGESVRDALCRVLSTRELLLVADNFEHLLDAAHLIGDLLAASRGLTVLVTSREALKLAAEHRFVVGPLALPDVPERATVVDVERASATAMFIAAARRRDHRWSMGPHGAPALARLCARLDGLPLALELAAARTGLFGIDELAARLDGELELLDGGPRDAPARQRTLRATLEWSYRLLDDRQKVAFARFSVFAGGSTLEAATEVTEAPLHTVGALIDKSLLDRRTAADASTRLMMLDTVRAYALERLAEDPDWDKTRRRHFVHFQRLAADAAVQLWRSREDQALTLLDREIENLRAALRWALANAPALSVRLAGPLGDYWCVRRDPDALGWVEAALAAGGEQATTHDRAHAQLARSYLHRGLGNPAAQRDAATEALELYRNLEDEVGVATSLMSLASGAMKLNDVAKGQWCAQEACRHARASGDDVTLGLALATLATAVGSDERLEVVHQAGALFQRVGNDRHIARMYGNAAYASLVDGRPTEALDLLEVAVLAAGSLDDLGIESFLCGNLGLAHLFTGDLAQAREQFTREIVLSAQQALRYGMEEGLAGLAAIAAAEGQSERAATLLAAARSLGSWEPQDAVILDRLERDYFGIAKAGLGAPGWQQAQRHGANMTHEEAIAYALHRSTPTDPQPAVSKPR